MRSQKSRLGTAVTYRVASAVLLLGLSYVITGQLLEALGIAASFAGLAVVLSFANEWAWEKGEGLRLGAVLPRLRSLKPRLNRSYEVDESSWLVVKGRRAWKWLRTDGSTRLRSVGYNGWASLKWTSSHLKPLAIQFLTWIDSEVLKFGAWLGAHWPGFAARARFDFRRAGLAIRWRRVPEVWELGFIDRMKAAEERGVSFPEVLRDTLPGIMGIDGASILGYWAGKKSMVSPEAFVRQMARMFGPSSKSVVTKVFDGLNEAKLLAKKAPVEPGYKSLVDAINEADSRKAMLQEMRVKRTTAIVPMRVASNS